MPIPVGLVVGEFAEKKLIFSLFVLFTETTIFSRETANEEKQFRTHEQASDCGEKIRFITLPLKDGGAIWQ